MKIETRQTKANEVIEEVRRDCESKHCSHYNQQVLESLKQLGDSPNPDDVDAVYGCKRTTIQCNECKSENSLVVARLGDEPDYESSTAWICLDCLRKAVAACEQVLWDEAIEKSIAEEKQHP